MSGDFSSHFGNVNGGVSHYHYQAQWMAHWMQGNNNVVLQCHASNKDDYPRGGRFQVENTQNRKGNMLSINSTRGCNLHDMNICRSDTEFSLALCPDQSAECQSRCKEGSLELQKKLKVKDARVGLSDTLSLHKLADASLNITGNKACYCLNPEVIISQDDHFPMYGINRRIGSILNQKKRSACGQMGSKLSEMDNITACVSNVKEFASDEHHQLEAKRLTDNAPRTELTKPFKTLPMCKDERTCSSKPAACSFSCSRPNFMLSNFTQLRMDSWSIDHEHNNHSTNKFKHESCDLSGSSRFCHSELKVNNEMISRCIRSPKPQKHIRHMSFCTDLWSDDLNFASLGNQHGKYQINTAGNETQENCSGFAHFKSSNDLGPLHQKSVPSCSANDAETMRIHTASNSTDNANGGSQNVSNSFKYWLIAKNMGTDLSHREQLNVNPTQSAENKTTALYEMLAMPAILHKQLEDSQHLVSSSRSSHCDDDSWSNAHIMITGKALSAKTTTIPVDICEKEVSLEPVVNAKPPKDPKQPQLIKFQSISPLPLLVKQEICRDTTIEMVDGHKLFPISKNAGSSDHREPSVSRTESMNVDLILSQLQNPNAPSSKDVLESSLQNEPCSRWLKRLRHSPSDIQIIGSKRSKVDGPTRGEACNVINYNDSNSDQLLNDVSRSSPSNAKCLPGASKKELKCWVKRWCHKSPQMPQSASALYEPENTKLSLESSEEKQFPSIAAMALMGKVMKRLRTCEFQKKGFSVIWNAESL